MAVSRKRLRQQGFTLLEIMVVVAIIAILSTVVVLNVSGAVEDASVSRAKQDVQALTAALQLYNNKNSDYPTTQQGLEALVSKPAGAPITWEQAVQKLPSDPWNRPYQYLNPGQHGQYDVYTLGKDGRPGGEGVNADIGNW
jgi:general secretion pathway protein G